MSSPRASTLALPLPGGRAARAAFVAVAIATAVGSAATPAGANPIATAMPDLGLPTSLTGTAPIASASRTASQAVSLPAVSWSLVTSGGYHSCAYLAPTKQIRCWGSDRHGEASPPLNLGAIKALSAGARHTCAVTTASKLECWGDNAEGQAEDPDVGPIASVSAGASHTCVVSVGGAPWCWGDNAYGQSDIPESLDRVRSISAGLVHTCAVTLANRAVCWGASDDNADDTLNKDKGQAAVPGSLGTVLQVSAGGYHTCALKTNRELACWGYDYSGQATPAEVNDLYSPFRQVSSGLYHTCATSMDGGVLCFGSDDQGQATTPELLGVATSVASGGGHSCAQSSAGDLACWGSDADGQATPPDVVMLGVSKTGFGTGIVTDEGADGAIYCGARCIAGVDRGTPITLTATADRGSRFIGWSGPCSGRGDCRVTLSSARSVTANFASNRPCVVPRTVGATQQAASAAIVKGGCTVGTVTKVRSRVRAGLVISSNPGAGSYRPLKTRVSLVVSRGSR